jgi:hypothetical protein
MKPPSAGDSRVSPSAEASGCPPPFALRPACCRSATATRSTRFVYPRPALQAFVFDPPNELVTMVPPVLIPTFLTPLSILLR